MALRVGAILETRKMRKHGPFMIDDDLLAYAADMDGVAREAASHGPYLLRCNVPAHQKNTHDPVRTDEHLARIEQAYRSIKTVDLHLRPIHHRNAHHTEAHRFRREPPSARPANPLTDAVTPSRTPRCIGPARRGVRDRNERSDVGVVAGSHPDAPAGQ